MKKTALWFAVLAMFALAATGVSGAEYDRDAVVAVMRSNVSLMREIQDAVSKADFFLAADKLYEIAGSMRHILPFDPPEGTKAAWDETVKSFVNTAYIGVGAAGRGDVEALNEVIATLRRLNQQGHATHR